MRRRIYYFCFLICLMWSCYVYANNHTESDIYAFMQECGIDINETTEWKYAVVGENEDSLSILNSNNLSNSLFVCTENAEGEVTESLIVGLEEQGMNFVPVDFETSNSLARDGHWNYVPSELNQAPIILIVQTHYTHRDGYSTIINPSGFTVRYNRSTEGNSTASVVNVTGVYEVAGPPFYGLTSINTDVPGYPYVWQFDRVEYLLERTFNSMTEGVSYTATKVFPEGYAMKVDSGLGFTRMTTYGQVITTSGQTKTFNVNFSGMELKQY